MPSAICAGEVRYFPALPSRIFCTADCRSSLLDGVAVEPATPIAAKTAAAAKTRARFMGPSFGSPPDPHRCYAPTGTSSTPVYRGLSVVEGLRRLVLRQAALEHAAGEDADELAVVHDRDALGVVVLEELEGLIQREPGGERPAGRLRDLADLRLARIAPRGDDLAHERLAREDADEAPVVADVDGAHFRLRQVLAGLLGRRVRFERLRLWDHGVADGLVHG